MLSRPISEKDCVSCHAPGGPVSGAELAGTWKTTERNGSENTFDILVELG